MSSTCLDIAGLTTTTGYQMAELRVVGKYRGPGEQLSAETLAQQLPADWVLIANRALPTREHDDLDLTVVGRNLIFVVEGKHWGPTVHVGPGAWLVKRQPRENPTERISFLARKLAGLLKTRVTAYPKKGHIVRSYVLLSYPNVEVDWSEAGPESDMVVLLKEAAQVLLDEDENAPVSVASARQATVAFLDGWAERDEVPTHIGSYNIHREISPLGRARVFAAHDDVRNFVFLRCYPMDGWGPDVDPNDLVRRERNAIQKLAHSGRTLESQPVFEDHLHRWIVVPIVQQPIMNLPRLLSMPDPPIDPKQSSVDQIAQFIVDAFNGLQKIHSEGVIHRGIAPARVALDPKKTVKFTDFYLARVRGEVTIAPSLNEVADLGAPFRAPECKEFIGTATPSSDIYSLALSLLWWLRRDPKGTQPSSTRSDLAEVANVLRRCTAATPEARPDIKTIVTELTMLQQADTEASKPQHSTRTFASGQLISERYLIERPLGEGGFAKSWLAVDQFVDQKRVLKQYSSTVPKQTAKKEFDAASKLVHERCARVWDISHDHAFLVVEYVEGESLGSASKADIAPEKFRRYALDVLDALTYVHDKDFLHNDISPGNIIIEPEGSARLIDFGLARLKEADTQVAFTPNFAAPEMWDGKRSPVSDLYALGTTFLYSMLHRYPYQDSNGRPDKSKIIPLTEEERLTLEPLGVAIAEQFFRLVAPDPHTRPGSAREFVDDLRRAAPIVIQEGSLNINATVDSLRQLYRGSKLGNAGNRGLDSEFAETTYVETLLDSTLTRQITRGELDLVILTGNPGDGKTSYLKKLRGTLIESGAEMLKEGLGGWAYATPDRTFAAVYDASEARDGKTSDELVIEALTAARPHTPHTALLAINDGRLRQFFVSHADLYPEYYETIKKGLQGKPPDGKTRVAYVDLKRRSLAPTASDPDGVAGRTLDTFTQESRWAVCETCKARKVCPILRNRSQLGGPGRAHLLELVVISHLRRERRATFRDFRSAAAWVITGDRGCTDVHQAIESGIDLRRGDDALHFDLAFDRRSTDYLIAEWSDIDPTQLPMAALERGDRASSDREAWHRKDSLNRRAFFGDLGRDSIHRHEATPYRYLADFQVALATDEETKQLLPRILLGLSRLLGAFGYDGRELAIQDGENDGWAVLRQINATEFRLERRAPDSPYVEQQADELLLLHPSARLVLTLDSVELILRAADGELINDAAANAIKLELSLLAGKLMLHPASGAIVVNPAGVPETVSKVDGSIVFRSQS